MITTASEVQIAVPLAACEAAQLVFEQVAPNTFDVVTTDRSVYALALTPTVPAFAIGQGRMEQGDYIALAAAAQEAGINHAVVATWTKEGEAPEVYVPPQLGQTLWEALGLVELEIE